MDTEKFLNNYLKPSEGKLDQSFVMPLPEIPGIEKSGEYIVQGKMKDTVSTNIISRYDSDNLGVKVIEVYKRTQNEQTGAFVRLVGTLSILKKGYPFLFLDAAVTNLDLRTQERSDLSTMVAIHMPGAEPENKAGLNDVLDQKAKAAGMNYGSVEVKTLPDFWGSLWHIKSTGADFASIEKVRGFAWDGYETYCEQTKPNLSFDYRPIQDQMIYDNAVREHDLFEKMGLQVAAETQAAFFSIMAGL